jgi:DNA polymerase II small subunit/DNA polymerase delta subunit B
MKHKVIKTIEHFESEHGQPKIKRLQAQLAAEHAKVEALADVQGKVVVERGAENRIIFGVAGDKHFGSLYHHNAALHAYYDHAKERGVRVVYDAGDLMDGHKIYKGQEFELRDIGLDAQIARIVADHPQNGIVTKFITGNHDASFKHEAGVVAGKLVQSARPDLVFLGEDQARIEYSLPNGKFNIMLLHPGGGSSYALSYRPQKIIESLEGGTKPDLLAIGHYHKADMIPSYRNVCGIQTGTFQRQTPFMAKGGLSAHVGGWIVEVTKGKGCNTIKAEFVAFYV